MSASKIQGMFRALRHRNFRLFLTGQLISLVGKWMQRVAMNWLIYRLTGSLLLLGAVDFLILLPTLLLGLFTGVLMEGKDLRKVLVVCQTVSMLHAMILAVLTLTGLINQWHILVLAAIIGISDAFEFPARQSFTVKLVDDNRDIGNAIGLSSMVINITRLIGPSVAGFIIAIFGEGICFLFNGVGHCATIIALLLMRFAQPLASQGSRKKVLEGLSEGIVYAMSFGPLKRYLIIMSIVSFFALPYLVLLPVFASDILQGGPQALGFLMGASGLGALLASIHLTLRQSPFGLGGVLARSCIFFGVSISAFALSRSFPLSLVLIAMLGFFMISTLISCNTLVQTLVDDDMRNRVMSLYTVAAGGFTPLGSLCAGWLASRIGAPKTLFIGGFVTLLAGLYLWRIWVSLCNISKEVFQRKGVL